MLAAAHLLLLTCLLLCACRSEGGHYSTNLDRNRYGSDNNYLFTGEG